MTPRNGTKHGSTGYSNSNSSLSENDAIKVGEKQEGKLSSSSSSSTTTTRVIQPDPILYPNTTYVHCTSKEPILPPNSNVKSAKEINDTELNLFLGCSWLNRSSNRLTLQIIRWIFAILLVEYWESYVYRAYNAIPDSILRYIIYKAWYMYYYVHNYLFSNTTGIHPFASNEYHALTTIMYLFRFLPVSTKRMRFALRQLTSCQPQAFITTNKNSGNGNIETIDTEFIPIDPNTNKPINVPKEQRPFTRVKGLLLHYNHHSNRERGDNHNCELTTEYTLVWIYGGAFLSGDTYGNLGPADTTAHGTNQIDTFLVQYRLAPEYCMDDLLWDIALAYRYIYERRKASSKIRNPNHILLFGCSSGAALCIRLMQYIAQLQRKKENITSIQPSFIPSILDGTMMPSGATLASPYIDYKADLDPTGSFVQYSCHDLIVTEAVQEFALPYLNTHMGRSGNRTTNSPFQHSMVGLPPLCIVVSQHETVYDETIQFINIARQSNVIVTVGIWKYMCHVFLFFNGFIPEGKQAMQFICDWYRSIIMDDQYHPMRKE